MQGKKRFPSSNYHYLSHSAVLPPDIYTTNINNRTNGIGGGSPGGYDYPNSRNYQYGDPVPGGSPSVPFNRPSAGLQSGIIEEPHPNLNQTVNVNGMVSTRDPIDFRVRNQRTPSRMAGS